MATCVFEDPLAFAVLRWDEIEELSFLDMEYPVPRRFRSGRGYLDVLNIDSEAFRHQFRFEQMDLMELCSALRVPHTIRTAQNVAIPGQEALCILLRRLSYPNRLCDLEGMLGRHSSTLSSATTVVLNHLTSTFGQLTADLSAHTWLNRASLDEFSEAVRAKGAPLQNCWGFVDGTARPICRPTEDQRLYFSGHKRVHAIKYQAIMCVNGIIVEMNGPYPGHRHDAGILRLSGLYERLEDLVQGSVYTIYGEIDYFRVPRAYWKDRLHKMRMAGLNTIASYVEWSGHEPQPGKLNFVDNYDLVEFCKEAQREDLLVILRVGPYICGWFLRWGDADEKGTPSKFMDTFKELIRRNASVNIYMFHGGTNFGFSAPSREGSPLVTSYDYNAPLSEAGDPRDLYHKLRDIIKDFAPLPPGDVPVASPKLNIGVVNLTEGVSLMEVIDHFRANGWIKKYEQSIPMTFEDMGQDYGFVMYTAKGKEGLSRNPTLVASGIKDRAYVVTNGSIHVLDSNHNRQILHFKEGETFAIRVFVENLGREFFKIGKDPKGITGRVTLNGHKVEGWTMEAVPVVENRDVSLVMQFLDNRSSPEVPGFFHGRFTLPPGEGIIQDTFLDPTGWKHGVAFINGIHLGRYWPRAGPQVTLYLPGAFMLPYPMENRLFLLEMEGAPENKTVKLVDKHVLNGRV
ncbi:beta-galactosidase-1-like protein [Ixodes scapularis]